MIFKELKTAARMSIVDGGTPIFVFISNRKCNQDFNETILETLSMPEKFAIKHFR